MIQIRTHSNIFIYMFLLFYIAQISKFGVTGVPLNIFKCPNYSFRCPKAVQRTLYNRVLLYNTDVQWIRMFDVSLLVVRICLILQHIHCLNMSRSGANSSSLDELTIYTTISWHIGGRISRRYRHLVMRVYQFQLNFIRIREYSTYIFTYPREVTLITGRGVTEKLSAPTKNLWPAPLGSHKSVTPLPTKQKSITPPPFIILIVTCVLGKPFVMTNLTIL